MRALGLLLLVPSLAFGQMVSFSGSAASFNATAPSGSVGFGLLQGARLSLNYPTNTAHLSYDGTDFLINVPASKGLQFKVNGTMVALISSAGLFYSASDVTIDGRMDSALGHSVRGGNSSTALFGTKTDGAAAVGAYIGNANTLTAASDRFPVVFCRDGASCAEPVSRPNAAGGIQLNLESTAAGTCDAARRGTIHYTPGGAGVADVIQVCSKSSGDAYAWRDLATPET